MTDTAPVPITSVSKPSARRTRVKLRRVNSDFSKPYPPAGGEKLWWDRLKAALGTTFQRLCDATLVQIQNASRMPVGRHLGDERQRRAGHHRSRRAKKTRSRRLWRYRWLARTPSRWRS